MDKENGKIQIQCNTDKKKKKKPFRKIVGFTIIAGIIAPIVIALFVYNPKILTCIPGEASTWFGFWASYIGAMVSLFVAYLTWENSKSIEKMQKEYYELDVNANLRLDKVSITPKIEQEGTLEEYWIMFVFENKAKCSIRNISIESDVTITIGPTKDLIKIKTNNPLAEKAFLFQKNNPILRFPLKLTNPSMKKAFAGFCYYYSQFSPGTSNMEIKMNLHIEHENGNTDNDHKTFKVELLPTPVIENRNTYFDISKERYLADAYEIYINNYSFTTYTKQPR